MPLGLRPNRCYVMFHMAEPGEDDKKIYVHVDADHPTAWREPGIMDFLNTWRSKGGTIEVIIGNRRIVLSPEIPNG